MTDSDTTIERVDYAARRRERGQARRAASRPRRVLIALGIVLGLVVLLVLADVALSAGRIHPGVEVAGVPVGGMSEANARVVLRTELPDRASEPVTVTYGDRSWEIAADQIDLSFDYDAQVRAAMAVGREDNLLDASGSRITAWFEGVELPAAAIAATESVAAVLDDIAEETDVKPVNAKVKIKDTTPRVVDGKDGQALDRDDASRRILATFSAEGTRTVPAPVGVVKKEVDAAAAGVAAETVTVMLSGPATVVYDDQEWEFSPEKVAKWIGFRSEATTGSVARSVRLTAFVDPEKAARSVVEAIGEDVGRPAKDARFTTSNGKVTIVPSRNGVGPDVESLSRALTTTLTDPSSDRTVELRTHRTEPEITTERARKMGIEERIGTYTTTFAPGNPPRVNNIHLLGDALDGTLVEPGGVFSFNESAGERTAAKGYEEAPAIVDGKLVPQLGGGVCQVGTTIFNAVFESGLPVVQRRNHSFYISHYPTGRDATVSWGGPDFQFKNDTKNWVLVSVSYSSSSITVSLYGTDPGYGVTAEVGEWRSIRDFPTERIKDKTMLEGSKVVEDPGVKGRSITVRRIVEKDGKVVRTDTFVSTYRPKAEVVRVGTKKAEPATDDATVDEDTKP